MPPRKEKKDTEMNPELIMQRKFRAKCLFRRIARLALANAYWLKEETEGYYEGVDDVKKRVAQAMRQKKPKKKTLLTLADKCLLNKPAKYRTDQEKEYIYHIIGGLKCFKKYPPNVKRKLAAVTYFKYFPPGRVIVRQRQIGQAMYFIVTGKVLVTHFVYDGLLNIETEVPIGDMHAGDMFGEVSLLHDIPRTATCTTEDHCELLVLMKEDFKNILQSTIQASWDIVRTSMSFFTYFDGLDEVSRREGCIIARMNRYAINDVIFGDNAEVPNFVYFVLEGRCQMIETLKVIETTRLGHTSYALYDPYVPKADSEINLDEKYFGSYGRGEHSDSVASATDSTTTNALKALDDLHHFENMTLGEVEEEATHVITTETKEEKERCQTVESTDGPISLEMAKDASSRGIPTKHHEDHHRDSVRFSLDVNTEVGLRPPSSFRTYFMQVCQFNPGSTFGLGENMRDRRIVALTPVYCMLLPKVWLLQKNTANIWTRIRHYLERKIPDKKQLFKTFVTERRWEEYREQVVEDVVSRSNTVNATTVHDVPYSIRMEEMLNL